MFLIQLPSNQLYVTPEQLPRLLANLSETHYVNEEGRYLQTVTQHSPVVDSTLATLLVKRPYDTEKGEKEKFQEYWMEERHKTKLLEAKLEKVTQPKRKRK